jgi:copper chaperone
MDPIILTLPDMTCGHCVKTVTRTVLGLDPAAQVQTDLGTHRVTLQTAVARDVLERALAAEGYPAAA